MGRRVPSARATKYDLAKSLLFLQTSAHSTETLIKNGWMEAEEPDLG